MKLSKPQKRALRTMYEHNAAASIAGYDLTGHYMKPISESSPPYWSTLLCLARDGLIILHSRKNEFSRYILTLKGRETAKELQDAEAV